MSKNSKFHPIKGFKVMGVSVEPTNVTRGTVSYAGNVVRFQTLQEVQQSSYLLILELEKTVRWVTTLTWRTGNTFRYLKIGKSAGNIKLLKNKDK